MNDKECRPEADVLNSEHISIMLYALEHGSFDYAKNTRDRYFPSNSFTRIPDYEEAVMAGLNRRGRTSLRHLPHGITEDELMEMRAFHHEFGRALIRLPDSGGYQRLLAGAVLTILDADKLTLEVIDEAVKIYSIYGDGVDLGKIEQFVRIIKQFFDHYMNIGRIEIAVKLKIGFGRGINFHL